LAKTCLEILPTLLIGQFSLFDGLQAGYFANSLAYELQYKGVTEMKDGMAQITELQEAQLQHNAWKLWEERVRQNLCQPCDQRMNIIFGIYNKRSLLDFPGSEIFNFCPRCDAMMKAVGQVVFRFLLPLCDMVVESDESEEGEDGTVDAL